MPDLPTIHRQLADCVGRARSRLGITREELAGRMGGSPRVISAIESVKQGVSARELVTLSWVLGVSLEQLLGVSEPSSEGAEPTMCAPAGRMWGRAQLDRWIRMCEDFRDLEVELGAERRGYLRPVNRMLSSFEEAEALAEEERARLELGPTPAHVLLGVLEERVGIKVFHLDLDDEISGASVVSPRFGPAVLVNRRHTAGRRAFVLAHELFHLLVRGPVLRAGSAPSWHLCDGPSRGDRMSRVEQMADRFAGRLLLPPDHFMERLRLIVRPDRAADPTDLIDIARYFGVSVQAVFVQLAQRTVAAGDVAMDGYRDPAFQESIAQAGSEWGPEPQRFRRLVVRAYLAERISRARMAELLGITAADVDDVLQRSGAGGSDRGIGASLPR